ncbi:hypothetical protein [Sphingobacterium haloxyli]|uniref:Uncharacterized protein n=1 Tax=Sphingobacterium haloxyli TaxID=2100533 RepID=A0A2S9J5G3_9SPHI|nr:hypothetical protein [Sphingobacterium haloxyli]PRD48038.1 hypothetical protein C5745_05865 [Sphingobacterium haloxyli]
MKKKLDTVGVAEVQAELLALSDQELQQETTALQQNFTEWMEEHFELTPSQLQQLHELPTDFRDKLTDAVAGTLNGRGLIAFTKKEKSQPQQRGENPKDIIIGGQQSVVWRVGDAESTEHGSLSIEISYG